MMSNDMDELCCFRCGEHLGWIAYAGPTGAVYCDSCHDGENEEDEEDEN